MAADKQQMDIEKTELRETNDGYMFLSIKTVRGDAVRDMDEVKAEFLSSDFESFKQDVTEFQTFMEYVADRARNFDPEREESEE